VSSVYDWLEGPFERRVRRAGVDRLAIRVGERVLELGYGTGHGLAALGHELGQGGVLVGLDLSTGMQRKARERLSSEGVTADLVCGDASALPLRAGSFDVAFTSFTLELFDTPEIPVVLGEVRRVLRPGGRLGVVALSLSEPPAVASRLYLAGHRRFPRLLDCRPIPTVRLLQEGGYSVDSASTRQMWGLPVDLVVASRAR
jgi:demethylmenaquinone methyltransferase/2-methoxy-6-polyprenyl-1,4-benzoquinol methylase